MGVVARETRRRWLIVAALVAMLCAVPVTLSALPVSSSGPQPAELRQRVRTGPDTAYQGLVETRGSLGLPDLPGLDDATDLLSGTNRIRAWYQSRQRWRVDVITPTGERDMYQTSDGILVWDFERDQLIRVVGDPVLRLPRAADLLPPGLARGLLGLVSPADRVTALPARRVAGVAAAGLRITPADPATTIGHVDVWADPDSGLAVEVRLAARGSGRTVLRTRFLELRRSRPAASAVRFDRPPGMRETRVGAPDEFTRQSVFGPKAPPARLAGRAALPLPGTPTSGARAYGSGFASFAVLRLPYGFGRRVLRAAFRAGAERVDVPGGPAFRLRTALLNAVIVHDDFREDTYLIAGTVSADTLAAAARDLVARPETGN